MIKCPSCNGTGSVHIEVECNYCGNIYMPECDECEGTGEVEDDECDDDDDNDASIH